MADTPVPVEVGFAEFTAKLISEVFEAVVAAQLDQEKRLAELVAAAHWTLEEFADRVITDEQTASELARLFPGPSPKYPTSIYVGSPYRPPGRAVAEQPPVENVLQLRLVYGDYVTRQQRTTLTARGVERITAVVRKRLAFEQHAAVQEIARRGVPRIIADAGRVNSKLTYEVVTSEVTVDSESASQSVSGRQSFIGGVAALPQPDALAKLRLKVRLADERAPQNQELQVNVYGEVEISFKTVT